MLSAKYAAHEKLCKTNERQRRERDAATNALAFRTQWTRCGIGQPHIYIRPDNNNNMRAMAASAAVAIIICNIE